MPKIAVRPIHISLDGHVHHMYNGSISNRAEGDEPMRNLLLQMAQELEFQLDASKGGNVRGITEDHRYQMVKSLNAIRSVLRRA